MSGTPIVTPTSSSAIPAAVTADVKYPQLPPGQESHLTNLLATQFNEAQLIWNRYNAMLTANTVLAAVLAVFLSQTPGAREWSEVVVAALFGFLLCVLWFALTFCGWKFSSQLVERVREVAGEHRNPLKEFKVVFPARDPIHLIAHVVIGVFASAYVSIIVYGMSQMSK